MRHMQLAFKNMLHTHVHEHMLRSLAKARKLRQPLQRPSHALLGTGFCLQGSNPGLSSLEEWRTLWESSCTAPLHFGSAFWVSLSGSPLLKFPTKIAGWDLRGSFTVYEVKSSEVAEFLIQG